MDERCTSYFSKYSFQFHLTNHHSKDAFKFSVETVVWIYEAILCIAVAYSFYSVSLIIVAILPDTFSLIGGCVLPYGRHFHTGYGRGYGIFIVIQWSMTLCFIESQWIYRISSRVPHENASRTGVRILPNIFETENFSAVEFAMGYDKHNYELSCDIKISTSLTKCWKNRTRLFWHFFLGKIHVLQRIKEVCYLVLGNVRYRHNYVRYFLL